MIDFELDGKVAIVTGASRGLGRASAIALLEQGVRVLAVARSVGVPVVVLGGAVGPGAEQVLDAGAIAVLPIADGATVPADLLDPDVTAANLQRTARSVVTLWLAARGSTGG